ncbi:MAG: metal ABC transporter permease [Planctomycetaceae bacterium]|nr:metal ABC transporter permease [Planctomycetaceae bacterium]
MWRRCATILLVIVCGMLYGQQTAAGESPYRKSLADQGLQWPDAEQLTRVFLLRDYNTRIVILGVSLLGCSAGLVGSFTLLRRRALMGDALSHATLPGIALAFMLVTAAGRDGKSMSALLTGATISGLAGVGSILAIRKLTRLKEDAALSIVLSVFFGAGVALLGLVQQMKTGHAAGLEAFIYGKTASMNSQDATLIAVVSGIVGLLCLLLFKEFRLLCFDEGFAGAEGYPVLLLDLILMSTVVLTSIVGLQAVGLVLVIALLVIPAAAARFWTESMGRMAIISSGIGAVGGFIGAAVSALFSRLPSGAMIVLVCAGCFVLSMLLGTRRGILIRWLRRSSVRQSMDHQHLLRAIYELLEDALSESQAAMDSSGVEADLLNRSVTFSDLLTMRSWSPRRLSRQIQRAFSQGLIRQSDQNILFTETGLAEAKRLTHQHRLWELYLITHADVAPGRVDQDADAIEHVLEPEVVRELEALLDHEHSEIVSSPHSLNLTEGSTVTAGGGRT